MLAKFATVCKGIQGPSKIWQQHGSFACYPASMNASMHVWFGVGLGVLLTSCGNPQDRANQPDQPANAEQPPVIVLGAPTPKSDSPKEPAEVAGDDPTPAITSPAEPRPASGADLATLVRDPRKHRWFPRATSLLITEIQSLEALLASVAQGPDRAKIIHRLAEGYIELKNAALRDKRHARDTSRPAEISKAEKLAIAAQKRALALYDDLIQSHPNFCVAQDPTDPTHNIGCLDETLYFAGLEVLELDKPDVARKRFFVLIKDFPQSKWIPYAYLSFGELFFIEGASDPSKFDFAQKSYEKVAQYPPPQNPTYGFAEYRLGQVYTHKKDFPQALQHMLKAHEAATNFASLASSDLLGETVRRDVVAVYAAAGTPRKAEPFFKRLVTNTPGSSAQLEAMLDALVRIYVRDNKLADATEVCIAYSGGPKALLACHSLVPSPLQQQSP